MKTQATVYRTYSKGPGSSCLIRTWNEFLPVLTLILNKLRGKNPCLFNGWTALVVLGLLYEASRSHSDTPHSVGILWTSDQPDTETSA